MTYYGRRYFQRPIGRQSPSQQAKTYVDIVMAIRCSLKSLVIISTESEERRYIWYRETVIALDKLVKSKFKGQARVRLLTPDKERIIIKGE